MCIAFGACFYEMLSVRGGEHSREQTARPGHPPLTAESWTERAVRRAFVTAFGYVFPLSSPSTGLLYTVFAFVVCAALEKSPEATHAAIQSANQIWRSQLETAFHDHLVRF
jgi:hypothetical protein